MIAALFVATDGVYFGLDGVEPWDIERDARKYAGTDPVVAHPPCERWGRFWAGGPSKCARRLKGDDAGCFASALASVRRCGGVLEHPADSHAWAAFGLARPPRVGGWVRADDFGGWTCCVEQGHYGHRARKATWLYAVGAELPQLVWGPSVGEQRPDLDDAARARGRRPSRTGVVQRMSKGQRIVTPTPFRDVLLSIARSAQAPALMLPGCCEELEQALRRRTPVVGSASQGRGASEVE